MGERRKWDSTAPSFKVCIIIPLEVYEKECGQKVKPSSRQENVTSSRDILQKETLPSGKKMKLFDEQFAREMSKKKRRNYTSRGATPITNDSREQSQRYEEIISRFQIEKQPFVRSILFDYIRAHRNSIDWDSTSKEMILNGSLIESSDIIKVLKFLLGDEGVSITGITPIGTKELFDRLMNLGVPRVWFDRYSSAIIDSDPRRKLHDESIPTNLEEESNISSGSVDDINESIMRDDDDEISASAPRATSSPDPEISVRTPRGSTWLTYAHKTSSPKELAQAAAALKTPSPVAERTRTKRPLPALAEETMKNWHSR